MANPFDQFDTQAANPFDQFDAPAPDVPSSDVNAPVAPLRSPTIGGEFVGGLKDIASSFSGLGKPQPLADTGSTPLNILSDFINTPTGKLGIGAVRVAASPYAPADAAAAKVGASAQDYLLSKGMNPTLAAALATAADMGTNAALTVGTGLVKKGVEKLFPNATESLANYLRPGRAVANEARSAADTAAAKVDAELAQKQADVAFENARMQQQAKTLEASMPGKTEAEKLTGGVVGKDVGTQYQKHYADQLAQRKDEANKLYDAALGPRAAGEAPVVDKLDTASQGQTLADAMRAARGTPNEAAATEAYKNFIETGAMPGEGVTLHDLHDQLIATRQEHRAATRFQNDNAARLLGQKEQSILGEMEKMSPGVTDKLSAADTYYKTDFAPYFSKGAITRGIAEKDPSVIARNAILPNTASGKAVPTIDRTLELVGKDTPLHDQIAQAHLAGLVDEASKAKDFRQGFISAWDKYTNPSGNNNEVLRKAYGKNYQNVESLVQQFRTAKSLDLKSVVKDVYNQGKSELQQAGVTAAAEKKAIEDRAKEQILAATGKPHDYNAGRFIGPLLITEGVIHSALGSGTQGVAQILSGIGVMMSRTALNKVLAFHQGRSIVKALIRSAPGSNQAFANARLLQNFLQQLPKESVPGQQQQQGAQ